MKLKELLPLINKRHGWLRVILVEDSTKEEYYKGVIDKVPKKYLNYKVCDIIGSYFEITIRISRRTNEEVEQ